MKSIEKLLFISIFVFLFSNSTVFAQTEMSDSIYKPKRKIIEIKTRPIGLILDSYSFGAEFQLKKNLSLEFNPYFCGNKIRPLYYDTPLYQDSRTIGMNINFRYYIDDSKKKLDRFYAGVYTNFYNEKEKPQTFTSYRDQISSLDIGFLLGYKIISRDQKVIIDYNLGLSRALGGESYYFTSFYSSLSIGYRFLSSPKK